MQVVGFRQPGESDVLEGVLEEIGACVETDLRVGDRVITVVVPSGSDGVYSEHIVFPIESVTLAPRRLNHVQAATLPMNGLTTRLALG